LPFYFPPFFLFSFFEINYYAAISLFSCWCLCSFFCCRSCFTSICSTFFRVLNQIAEKGGAADAAVEAAPAEETAAAEEPAETPAE
jgi:hypothetical protein